MCPLSIAGWAHGESSGGPTRHRVVVFFVDLGVGPIFNATMSLKIDGVASYDGTGTEDVGNTVSAREGVQPEITVVDHFDNHPSRKSSERHSIVYSATAFLDDTNVSFDFWYMVVVAGRVKTNLNVREIAPDGFKFIRRCVIVRLRLDGEFLTS